MKKIIILLIFFALPAQAQIIKSESPDGGLHFTDSHNKIPAWNKIIKIIPEFGRMNGLAYHWNVNKNGYTGVVANDRQTAEGQLYALNGWLVSCQKDLIDDQKSCSISIYSRSRINEEVHLAFTFDHLGPEDQKIIGVGTNHYPRSSIQLRVDKNKFHVARADAGFNGTILEELISEITSGKKVITRYKKWPYQSWVEMAFISDGFAQAIKLSQFLYEKL